MRNIQLACVCDNVLLHDLPDISDRPEPDLSECCSSVLSGQSSFSLLQCPSTFTTQIPTSVVVEANRKRTFSWSLHDVLHGPSHLKNRFCSLLQPKGTEVSYFTRFCVSTELFSLVCLWTSFLISIL